MLHLMSDAETLALGENALILQWGLAVFNDDYEILSELCLNIDITASIMEGYEINESTIQFWRDQSNAAQAAVLFEQPRLAPSAAASIINQWLHEQFNGKNFEIWANGILFDIPKLDRFLERYGWDGVTARTKYNKVNDLRTLSRFTRRLYPELHEHAKLSIPNAMQHHALADCVWQIQLLSELHAILAGEYDAPKKQPIPGSEDFYTGEMTDYPIAPAPVAEEVETLTAVSADDDFTGLDDGEDFESLTELAEAVDALFPEEEHVDPPTDGENDDFMAHLYGGNP